MDQPVLPPSARIEGSVSAVALVGFMGAGKTTVGEALARRLGWHFADLDQLVEKYRGLSVPEIFRLEGESAFRHLEYSVLCETIKAAGSQGFVVALGGGAFAVKDLPELLARARVPAVCLDASVEELYRRCEQPGVIRPLRTNLQEFRELYEKRRLSYAKANLRISTDSKDVASIVQEIISGLGLVPGAGVAE